MSFLSSYRYFDDLFEKLVALHEQLDTASSQEKEMIVSELRRIQNEGDEIQKQWLVLQEYIDILNSEYNLECQVSSISNNKSQEGTNQIFWVADEESVTTFRKGLGYFELLMFENSLPYFQETVEKDPNFVMARVYLGLSYLSLGELDKAETELKKTLLFVQEGTPYQPLTNHALGVIYAQNKKYDVAQKYFHEVIKANPNFKNIYFNLGATYYNQQKYEYAKSTFMKGLELHKDDWELHYLTGKCFLFLMDFENALIYLRNSFRVSNKLEVGLALGKVYELTNKLDLANGLYQQLLELYPNDAEIHHRSSWLYIYKEEFDLAVTFIKKAISLKPMNTSYVFTLGWIYLQTDMHDKATLCFDYIKKHPENNVLSNIGLSKYFITTKAYDNAKDQLLQAIRFSKNHHELGVIAYHLGYYWLQLKQYKKSYHSFLASVKYAPYLSESNFYIQVLNKINTKKNMQPIV